MNKPAIYAERDSGRFDWPRGTTRPRSAARVFWPDALVASRALVCSAEPRGALRPHESLRLAVVFRLLPDANRGHDLPNQVGGSCAGQATPRRRIRR